jgi:hypothetical protein
MREGGTREGRERGKERVCRVEEGEKEERVRVRERVTE